MFKTQAYAALLIAGTLASSVSHAAVERETFEVFEGYAE